MVDASPWHTSSVGWPEMLECYDMHSTISKMAEAKVWRRRPPSKVVNTSGVMCDVGCKLWRIMLANRICYQCLVRLPSCGGTWRYFDMLMAGIPSSHSLGVMHSQCNTDMIVVSLTIHIPHSDFLLRSKNIEPSMVRTRYCT